jgi:DNA-binding protein YbaB
MVADMVMAATNDALDKSRDMAAQQMGQLTAGLGLPPGLL